MSGGTPYRDGCGGERVRLDAELARLEKLAAGIERRQLSREVREDLDEAQRGARQSGDAPAELRARALARYDRSVTAAILATPRRRHRRRVAAVVAAIFALPLGYASAATDLHGEERAFCHAQPECEQVGACSPSAMWALQQERKLSTNYPRCEARYTSDCERSCELYGRCSLRDGVCEARREMDCMASLRCKTHGACVPYMDGSCAPETAADCRASEACKTQGACRLRVSGVGVPYCSDE